jgi:hypothetical protein
VALVGLNAIDMMFFIPAYPFWALTIIAIDVVALYGLCAYGSRKNLDAACRTRPETWGSSPYRGGRRPSAGRGGLGLGDGDVGCPAGGRSERLAVRTG